MSCRPDAETDNAGTILPYILPSSGREKASPEPQIDDAIRYYLEFLKSSAASGDAKAMNTGEYNLAIVSLKENYRNRHEVLNR